MTYEDKRAAEVVSGLADIQRFMSGMPFQGEISVAGYDTVEEWAALMGDISNTALRLQQLFDRQLETIESNKRQAHKEYLEYLSS
jgi:hypothetical protein